MRIFDLAMGVTRKVFSSSLLLGWLTEPSPTTQNRTLAQWAVEPLPLGTVKPLGWLQGEMQAMADGFEGHQYDFWPWLNNSKWLHPTGSDQGQEFGTMMSSVPYWFNGLVPLAYSLDDERLKGQVHEVMNKVLDYQAEDGWIGPENMTERNFWTNTPFIMGMTQLIEANSTWEEPLMSSLRRYFDLVHEMMLDNARGMNDCENFPGIVCQWGQNRVHDMILSIHWLLDNRPSEEYDDELWETMRMMHDMTPIKWEEYYMDFEGFPRVKNSTGGPLVNDSLYTYTHGVNVGQNLKANAVAWRFNQSDLFLEATDNGINWTFTYHGSPTGSVLGDEIEHDGSPYMGSELCTAVETGYSFSYLYHSLGRNPYADRSELVIFNDLPAHKTGNHWGHQYMNQPNQPWARNNTQDFEQGQGVEHVFTTSTSGYATTYGLESEFPCCSVNHPQGWPKFLGNSWGTVGDRKGLAHVLLGPSKVSTTVRGKAVSVECDTSYPFGDTLRYRVESETAFELYVRVPEWADQAETRISVNGQDVELCPDSKTGLQVLDVPSGQSTITYTLITTPRVETRPSGAVSVYHGNLLYSLYVSNEVQTTPAIKYGRGPFYEDVPYPEALQYFYTNTSAWNIAIDPSSLEIHGISTGDGVTPPSLHVPIFEDGAPPTYMTVRGCPVEWDLYLDTTPDRPPKDPECIGEVGEYRLVPYGAAKLHMSELPVVHLTGQ